MTKNLKTNPLNLLLLSAFLTTAALSLSACGFAPLYGQAGLTQSLSRIDIDAPNTRIGYFIRQNLLSSLGDDSGVKLYKLKITVIEKRYDIGLSVQNTATRFESSNAVSYILSDNNDKTLFSGNFVDTVTYDATENAYAGVAGQQSAQIRAATSISDKIQNELALYFHDKKQS